MTQLVGTVSERVERESPWQVGGRRPRRRRGLLVGTGLAFALVTTVFGLPTGREVVTAWLLLLLYAIVGGDGRTWRRSVVRDWLPLLAVLFGYDLLRGFADRLVSKAHVLPQLRAEEFLFGGRVPTVWLQEHLYHPVPSWYDYAIVPVYLSFFVVPMAVAAAFWASSYNRFQTFASSLVVLFAATLTTYAAFPAAPPWLASESSTGLLPHVERVTPHTLLTAGIPTVHNAVQRGEVYGNPVAAIPSLHSAVPMLVLLLMWPYCRAAARGLLVAYVLAMTFTLVYGGEHYMVDVFLGWLYALAAVLAVRAVTRRRRHRT